MIKVNEVRSGNLLECDGVIAPLYGTGKAIFFVEVEPLTSTDDGSRAWKPSQTNGIPLTEEWLLKFGFEIDPDNKDVYLKGGQIAIDTEMFMVNFIHESDGIYIRVGINETPFVHQLQNLYFALTGEELKVSVATSPNTLS